MLFYFVGLIFSGEGLQFIGFVQRHPEVVYKMLAFGVASAIGQVSNYSHLL